MMPILHHATASPPSGSAASRERRHNPLPTKYAPPAPISVVSTSGKTRLTPSRPSYWTRKAAAMARKPIPANRSVFQPGRGPSGSRAACLRLRSLSRNGVSNDKSSAAMSTLLIEPSNMTDIRPPSTERDKSTLFPRFSSIIGPRMTPRAIAPVSMPTLPPKNPTSPKASTTHMSTRLLLMA